MKASKKNSQATEVKNNAMEQPQTERQSLRSLCKKLREEYGNDERINNLLCIYYKKLHNLSILKTREQWEREGFKVMNTVENDLINGRGAWLYSQLEKELARERKRTQAERQFEALRAESYKYNF